MCGLWGLVNKEPRKFDYQTYCTLGIHNDVRGGDSCGIFIDGHVEYGASKENKLFQDFFINCDYLNTLKESSIAFGHCRKASVGSISKETAQPVVIRNSEGNIDYVLMHNGTIYNYEELAEKYIPTMPIKGLTDSQVMALIFYHTGYKALSEYNGAAVFAIADYRDKEPIVYLYKGASKKTKYSTTEEDERPLFFTINKEQLIFSSTCSYLFALEPNIDIYTLQANTLFQYIDSDLKTVLNVDRSKMYQEKPCSYYDYYSFNYLSVCYDNNKYYSSESVCHGKVIVSNYGLILNQLRKDAKALYFWDGILLKNKACFNYISNLYKKSGYNKNYFNTKYNLLIRFLSIDGIYVEYGLYYKAIAPNKCELFNGNLNMISSSCNYIIKDGVKVNSNHFSSYKIDFTIFEANLNIKEQCKSLMN